MPYHAMVSSELVWSDSKMRSSLDYSLVILTNTFPLISRMNQLKDQVIGAWIILKLDEAFIHL